ncbi:MAG: addiction module antidote protein, HigA family, partial [Sphingobacteriaceae bacterium]
GKTLTPHQAIHPGLLIKDELAARDIKQTDLAADTNIQPTQLSEILKGKRPLSTEHALLIAAVLDTSPEVWTEMQAKYDLHKAQIESGMAARLEALKQLQEIRKVVDVNYFRREGIVTGRAVADVQGLLNAHDYTTVQQLVEHLTADTPAGTFYKKSEKLVEYKPFVNSWVRYVKHLALREKVAAFDFDCQDELIGQVKKIFQGSDVKNKLSTTFKEYGIKLVFQGKPDKTPLDGAALWQDKNPILALTERHSRYDNFLFTVYHELGHIFLHLKDKKNRTGGFVDSLDAVGTKGLEAKENEANTFARNTTVPANMWADFVDSHSSFTDDIIGRFAKAMHVPAPSIWGRLCFEKRADYACFSVHRKTNIIP